MLFEEKNIFERKMFTIPMFILSLINLDTLLPEFPFFDSILVPLVWNERKLRHILSYDEHAFGI